MAPTLQDGWTTRAITDAYYLNVLGRDPGALTPGHIDEIVRQTMDWTSNDHLNRDLYGTGLGKFYPGDDWHTYVVFNDHPNGEPSKLDQKVGVFLVWRGSEDEWFGTFCPETLPNWHYVDMPQNIISQLIGVAPRTPNRIAEWWRARCYTHGKMDPPVLAGIGATYYCGSDCTPYEVTRVHKSGKTAWVRRLDYKMVGGSGQSETQIYDYGEMVGDEIKIQKCRKKHHEDYWTMVGRPGTRLTIGHATAYRDPHF